MAAWDPENNARDKHIADVHAAMSELKDGRFPIPQLDRIEERQAAIQKRLDKLELSSAGLPDQVTGSVVIEFQSGKHARDKHIADVHAAMSELKDGRFPIPQLDRIEERQAAIQKRLDKLEFSSAGLPDQVTGSVVIEFQSGKHARDKHIADVHAAMSELKDGRFPIPQLDRIEERQAAIQKRLDKLELSSAGLPDQVTGSVVIEFQSGK